MTRASVLAAAKFLRELAQRTGQIIDERTANEASLRAQDIEDFLMFGDDEDIEELD